MFNPKSIEEGKSHVVGNCNGIDTEVRWKEETPIFAEIIQAQMGKAKIVLDFGCGVGRVARTILDSNKEIKELWGLDTSGEMLEVAKSYVLSDRFHPSRIGEHTFSEIGMGSTKFDYVYCIYVLQHIPALELRDTIRFISGISSRVFVVNSCVRMAVKEEGFHDDGVDVLKELSNAFSSIKWGIPAKYIIENKVMRTMFMDGNTKHYGVLCENEK